MRTRERTRVEQLALLLMFIMNIDIFQQPLGCGGCGAAEDGGTGKVCFPHTKNVRMVYFMLSESCFCADATTTTLALMT